MKFIQLISACLALSLAACGGSSGSDNSASSVGVSSSAVSSVVSSTAASSEISSSSEISASSEASSSSEISASSEASSSSEISASSEASSSSEISSSSEASSSSEISASSDASSSSEISSSSEASSSSSSSTAPFTPVTIHMLGDSTMTMYTEDRRPQAGWGEKVENFYNDDVTVINWARGGRSSRSFYSEVGRWPDAKLALKEGDYVIIQFAHNDQKVGGDYEAYGTYAFCSDGTTNGETCSDVDHSYYQYLKKYVLETREKGAIPVLMTPIVRKYFSGTTITSTGQHNLTNVNSGETFPRGDYSAAMKAVATAYDVPLVDLTDKTRIIVEAYGSTAATDYLYIQADSTHPTELFATLIAKRAVEGMKDLGILENGIVQASSVVASPSSLDWENRYIGVSTTKKLTLSGFDLNPKSGAIMVTAPAGFQISADQENWSSELAIDYSNGDFTKSLSVQFTPQEEKSYSETLNLTLLGTTMGSVELKGVGVAAGSGLASYASWFTAAGNVVPVVDGLVNGNDAQAVGLVTSTNKVFAVDGQDTTVVRYVANNHSSRSETEYLQFVVSAASGAFSVDTISAYLTSSGGSTVQADILYSLSSDFSNPVKLNETPLAFTKDVMTKVEFGVTVQVPMSGSLYLRIYPWNTASNTGKTLAVYDVRVSGLAGE